MTRFTVSTILAALCLLIALPRLTSAQGPAPRIEAGLGFGQAGEGSGLNGRLGFGLFSPRWGGLIRLTAHDGGEGEYHCFFFCGTPKESFYDTGLLVLRVFPLGGGRMTLGTGVAGFSGQRVSREDPTTLEDVSAVGVPVEVGLYGGADRRVGAGITLVANLNSVTSQVGAVVSITVGRWRAIDR